MARSLPPLTWFRAFESAARNLNFTAAAHELGLTQSAISQQVSALEARFGCLLFIRKNRGLALTDQGRKLVPMVTQAMATLRMAADSFETETDKRMLNVATSVSISQWYLVPRMREFSKANDDVAIRLMTKVWPDEFADAGVDVEIRFDALKSRKPPSVPLGSTKSVIVASPNLVGNIKPKGPIQNTLGRYPLIQVVGTSDTWQIWAQNCDYEGEINPSSFVDSHGMAVDLARSGAGIALTSQTIAAPSLCDGSLIQLPVTPMNAKDGYQMTVFPTRNADLAGKFAQWLTDIVAETEIQIKI